jgi:hypothetical protein
MVMTRKTRTVGARNGNHESVSSRRRLLVRPSRPGAVFGLAVFTAIGCLLGTGSEGDVALRSGRGEA